LMLTVVGFIRDQKKKREREKKEGGRKKKKGGRLPKIFAVSALPPILGRVAPRGGRREEKGEKEKREGGKGGTRC